MAIASLRAAREMAQGYLALKDEISRQQFVIDLQGKILEAQGNALDAQEAQRALVLEIERLKSELAQANDRRAVIAAMTRNHGLYFKDQDPDPYCPRCAEVDGRLLHLTRVGGPLGAVHPYKCPQCKSSY